MFERFSSRFRPVPTDQHPSAPRNDTRTSTVAGYAELMSLGGGCSYENGLYRLHSSETGQVGQDAASAAFPEYADRLSVFGFDWLGRQFALDFGRIEGNEPQVMLLEPGTGEALEIPVTFAQFHDEELVDYSNEALADEFFGAWSAAHPDEVPLKVTDCVGYRVPLFLGGHDDIDNLEVVAFDVYWELMGQARRQAAHLRPGTPIRDVSIED